MSTYFQLIVFFLTIACICSAGALQCYECDSILDDGCGVTWGLSVVDAENYKVTCPDGTRACKKLISLIDNAREKMVTRSCWNINITEQYTPKGCEDTFDGIESCYCTGSLCNGQRPLYAVTGVIVLGVIVALLKL